MSKVYPATGLTGGTTGCLDAIDGTDLADKDVAIVTVQDGNMYPYVLDADSAESESSPLIISPDANAGDKRWKLVGVHGAFSHVEAYTTVAQSIPDATATVIIFGTEGHDELSEFNTTTGVFTATYAGIYLINSSVTLTSGSWTEAQGGYMRIRHNSGNTVGGPYLRSPNTGSVSLSASISHTLKLAATDTIDITLTQSSGGAITLATFSRWNRLSIDRIA